jgi:Predicted membrane protein
MIGALYTGVWFLGSVLSYLIIIPLGPALGLFPDVAAATAFKNTAGIGLMVGTGIGILISYILASVKTRNLNKSMKISAAEKNPKKYRRFLIAVPVLVAFVLSIICGLGPIASVLMLAGIFAASAMAATITGETGINPMEIFGIIILLAVRLIVPVDAAGAFFIAAAVAVACGYAGDLLNDYKAGHILGTNPTAQLISQTAGGLVGTFIAAAAMFALIGQFGGVGPDKGLPAGQAFAVSQMVNGIGSPMVFTIAALIGVTLYLVKLPAMTLGIGMYLSSEISSVVFLGGLIRFISDKVRKKKSSDMGTITASGLLGGEGITGVAIAIVKMFSGT